MNEPAAAVQPLSPEEEQALIERARGGEEAAFELLVKAYMRRAYFISLQFTGNHEDAMDCSQEVFVKIHRALKRFRPGAPFFPWLYKISKNHCLNYIKRRKRHQGASLEQWLEDYGLEIAHSGPSPRAQAATRERDDQLRRCVAGLKTEFREIVLLKHFHDLSYKEIAETLEIPMGTVMSRLYNARAALKERLEEKGFQRAHAMAEEEVED